jgi:hypothetical protein
MTIFGVCPVVLDSRRPGRWDSALLDLSQPQNGRRGKYFRLGFSFRIIVIVCILPVMTISGLCDCRARIVLPTTAVKGCFSRSPASRGGAALRVARYPIGRGPCAQPKAISRQPRGCSGLGRHGSAG